MRYLKIFMLFSFASVLIILTGCSPARKAFSKAEKFESEGKYEEAMYGYAEAFRNDSEKGEYRVKFFNMRDKASLARYNSGKQLFSKGDYAGALNDFQTAYGLDPTRERYKQQMDISTRLKDGQLAYLEGRDFEKANKIKDAIRAYTRALELHSDNKEYREALTRVSGLRKSKLEGYELSLKSAKPISLKFKDAKLKDVFKIVTQLSGINFVFDEAVKDQPVTIYLENATFQQALDLITSLNKLGRKVLNEGAVLIYPRTPEKIKQYEDMVLRTFHLNYLDAKKAVNLVRTMLQVRKIYVNEDSNSLVVRDTADLVEVVEKILDANDVPEPEVILEVEVIEVSDSNKKTLGLLLDPYSVQMGGYNLQTAPATALSKALTTTDTTAAAVATGTTGTTTTTATAGVANLVQAFAMKGYGGFVTVPNATYHFGKTITNGEVLSNPKIRVKNKEKSKFNVGKRLPIVTTTISGSAVSQANVQYVDVGVKLNAEPTIQLNNEITIKLSLEVSQQIGQPQTVSGATVVTIGTRNLDTVLSLKDGETSIIGGLIETTQGDAKNKIYLLGDIPWLGDLISYTDTSNTKSELILAITPRLVRGVTVPQAGFASFMSGREDDPSLHKPMGSFDQEPVQDVPPKGAEKPVQPAKAQPVNPQPVVSPVPVAIQPVPVKPAPPAAVPAAPKRGLLQLAAPASVNIGQQFTVDIKASDVANLLGAPFVLTYDPVFVDFISMKEGSLLNRDGVATTFSAQSDAVSGNIKVSAARPAASGGISGAGILASVLFRAKNQGAVSLALGELNFVAPDGRKLDILPFSTVVDVR